MMLLPNFASIVSRGALQNIGAVESRSHIYLVKNIKYSHDMFPRNIWEHVAISNEEKIFIKGTVLLSLGQEVLLCPDFVIAARKKYLKYNFDNLFSSRNELHSMYLKSITRSCILFDKSEIKQWDSIIDGKNILNK
ncbi:hypothetical protein H4F51_14115 [Pectobacterium brasiliense]|uniref:hypothetical protein n=1 Tax=Pectobacterium brasiliense TaxID=180957 RepID=UPI0015DE9FA8|nr:hypothetical protein [Pectobacterium brasiliense]MBA0196280.1 hypothetical protein [Pectobacterium brasiliense]MBN3093300.1 hypothetical protein [Pectobacterium brasiliense]MBN3141051.1 hypothetical protein [Pectobacterium brasiliense]